MKNPSLVFMCLPSREAQLTAKRWGFPPADWWQWSSRLRNPSALDCGEPRTPAETQQHFSQSVSHTQIQYTHTRRDTQEYSLSHALLMMQCSATVTTKTHLNSICFSWGATWKPKTPPYSMKLNIIILYRTHSINHTNKKHKNSPHQCRFKISSYCTLLMFQATAIKTQFNIEFQGKSLLSEHTQDRTGWCTDLCPTCKKQPAAQIVNLLRCKTHFYSHQKWYF